MAEYTRPWPGTTLGDAGPYSAENWYDVWGSILNAGVAIGNTANYDYGVLFGVGNKLFPSENGANIDVDTGAGIIDGLFHYNDATVSVPINAPAANPRIDYIVVRKNYQAAVTYTPAGAAPTVPPRTARITVIRGAEAAIPATPSLTQDTTRTTYWDIPIATVQVSVAGVLSSFTDQRQFAGNNFGTSIIADDNTAIKETLQINLSVEDGAGDDGLGSEIATYLEDDAGNLQKASGIVTRWTDSTNGSEESRIEFYVTAGGSDNLSGVINAPSAANVDGNARGQSAVDFQQERNAVTQVASGTNSTISGGNNNTASGLSATVSGGNGNIASGTNSSIGGGTSNVSSNDNTTVAGGTNNNATASEATVGGGLQNDATGDYSTIPGGYYGLADKYAQVASASGFFAAGGDAQGTIQMVARATATHNDATWYSLYLDGAGASERMTIAASTAWTFHILLIGITQNAAQQFSYEINGIIERDNANNTTLAASNVTAIFESDANYNAQVVADDVNEALAVQVQNNGGTAYTVRWVATIRMSEVTFP